MKNGSSPGLAILYDRASTAHQRDNWSRADAKRFLDTVVTEHGYEGEIRKRQSILAMTRGLKEKARQGKLQPTYAVFGYEWAERWPDEGAPPGVKPGSKKPGADLVVVPEEADVVRRIFSLYEEVSQRQVAMRLNKEGLRKPVKSRAWRRKVQSREKGERVFLDRAEERMERLWTPKDISDIVSNRLYAGLLTWGNRCTSRFLKDFEGVQHHRPDLQIVSLEQFNRCQRLMKERRRVPPTSVGSPYVFSGLIRCTHCGGRMVGKRHRERRGGEEGLTKRYECRAYHIQGKQGCRGQSVYETTARKAVLPALVDLLENHLKLDDALREVANELATPSIGQRRDEYTAELAKIAAAQERLVEAVAEGLLPGEAIRRKQLDLMEKKEYAEKRLASLDRNRESTAEIAQALQVVEADLTELLENAPEPQLARLCRLVFRAFSVEATGVAKGRKARIESYEFTPEFADLLAAHSSTPTTDTPACEIVWCGARNGRWVISGVSAGSRPLTL